MSPLLLLLSRRPPSLDLAAVWPAGALCCEVISAEEESWGNGGSSGMLPKGRRAALATRGRFGVAGAG